MQTQPHPRPEALNVEAVVLIAVEVLDALVADLIERSKQTVDCKFLDWVADALTPSLEAAVTDAMRTEAFIDILRTGDLRVALLAWVKYWVCPKIRRQFETYSIYCPCMLDAPVVFYKDLK